VPDRGNLLTCSFCGTGQQQVKQLVVGTDGRICDECLDLCDETFSEEPPILRGDRFGLDGAESQYAECRA
jgi:ATP-dependent Clp protease ATP-binding subunit ClpX